MTKRLSLLSIGGALVWSLCVLDVGHAVQTEKKQDIRYLTLAEIQATLNAPTARVSSTAIPCTEQGNRGPGVPCQKQSLPGSGERALDRILYTIAAITATLIVTLISLILWVLLSRRIPLPPFVKSSQH